jgi:hypothetical protein
MPEIPAVSSSAEPVFASPPVLEPMEVVNPEPVTEPAPVVVSEPVWSMPEPVAAEIPVWSAPEAVTEPVLPVWSAPEPVAAEPVLPVWSAPEPVVVQEPTIPVWSAPEPVAVVSEPVIAEVVPDALVVPEPVPVVAVPEPVVAPVTPEPVPAVAVPEPVIAPVAAAVVVPSYIAPNTAVVSDFFQLFAARSHFNPKSLEDIRAQLKNSLNNRDVSTELFLARAAARALHLLGLEKFSLARLESGGLQAYTVNGLQHSFLEAIQGLARATPAASEGLLVVDASHLGVDDLVLPSAAGVLALGRDGKLTLSGNLPPLQSTEFLHKVVELLEHPVGLVI